MTSAAQKLRPAVAYVCNTIVLVGARVIVCGTAMTIGLHSWLASAVGKIPTGAALEALEPVALGDHLRAWSKANALQFLRSFVAVDDTVGAGDAGVSCTTDTSVLDIIDVPGLFPCEWLLVQPRLAVVCCEQAGVRGHSGALCGCLTGRPRLMALYVAMLTRPAFAVLGRDERLRILKDVFLGDAEDVPMELTFEDGSNLLRRGGGIG